jgi:hypothetical protein
MCRLLLWAIGAVGEELLSSNRLSHSRTTQMRYPSNNNNNNNNLPMNQDKLKDNSTLVRIKE